MFVDVYMYIYIYIYTYIYMYIYTYMYTYVYMCVYVCVCVCIDRYMNKRNCNQSLALPPPSGLLLCVYMYRYIDTYIHTRRLV